MRKLSVLLLLVVASPLRAQAPGPDEALPPERLVHSAAPLAGQIRIDGRFDEPAWAGAEAATDFTQAYPDPGAPASERTEVRLLVGPDALYVAARMYDSRPDSIAAQLSRRDVTDSYSDRILVFLGSHNDRRTAFSFGVNPRGVKVDSYHFDDRREDQSWDAVWDVATTVDSLGWAAEFRIPLSQLRFSDRSSEELVWGLGLMRDIARRDERNTWSPWTRNSPGFVSAFGELRGLTGIRAPKRLEIMPYTSARLERVPGDPANPFYRSNQVNGSVGADVQYGLPGGLTLTGTVNPDFGQVEVDPAVVNLTAFETFFPERRPFFVEGTGIFRFGEIRSFNRYAFNQFFYTRRIGRSPQRFVRGNDVSFVDAPDQSTILAAAKVSGRTAGGWSVGLMNAVTAREDARYLTRQGEEVSTPVEPLSNYFVGRLRRDLNQGNTVLGGMFTGTHRDMKDGTFDGLLRSSAYLAGVDGEHSWSRRAWTVSGFLAGSQVNGDRGVISATQRSSAHYFHRPDADHLTYDTTHTSLGGYMGAASLQRNGSWHGSLTYQVASPGFETNDLGFQPRVDYHAFTTLVGRQIESPGKVFRRYSFSAYSAHAWNFGGDRIYDSWSTNLTSTFRNLWWSSLTLTHDRRAIDDRLTFGGPAGEAPPEWRARLDVVSDRRKKLSGSATAVYGEDTDGGYQRVLGLSASLRPSSSLEVSLGPTLTQRRFTQQYVGSVGDPLATHTFGRRYVFADTDQTRLAMTTRVSWTFTPNLSLQVYAQPYVNSADFSGYKEFSTPRTSRFDVYGRDAGTIALGAPCGARAGQPDLYVVDPDGDGPAGCFQLRDRDFTFRSLRGNAVLRWEYRPGSTLFFVWQQVRSGAHPIGQFDLGRDTGGIFGEPAQNVFLVKATYWLSR